MDVYVESNFVLELALLQEQQQSCEKIVELCESGKIQLVLPAYSLVEPYWTLVGTTNRRRKLRADLENEVSQKLSRSEQYREHVEAIQRITGFLVRSGQDENKSLWNTQSRLLNIAEVIPLSSAVLSAAMEYQAHHDLTFQDSIVYVSVLNHLSASTATSKCFLNRDTDFDDPDIENTLRKLGCAMRFRFDDGYNFITSQLRR
jgi:predicted nucleic acid-binding protein